MHASTPAGGGSRGFSASIGRLVALCLFLGFATNAGADLPVFSSRLLSPDPVWQALQGSRAATAGDVTAGLGNPAAGGLLPGGEVTVSHLAWASGLSREWVGAGLPLAGGETLIGDAGVLHTAALPAYDEEGASVGTIQPSEWTGGLSLAVPLGGGCLIGVGGRAFQLTDPTRPVTAFGASAGLLLGEGSRRLGLALTDLGPSVSSGGQSYPLPTRWRAGLEQGFGDGHVIAMTEAEGASAGSVTPRFGVAFGPTPWLRILGGVCLDQSAGEPTEWSVGLHVEQKGIGFSYAYLPAGELGATHQFGLSFRFGRSPEARRSSNGDPGSASAGESHRRPASPPATEPDPGPSGATADPSSVSASAHSAPADSSSFGSVSASAHRSPADASSFGSASASALSAPADSSSAAMVWNVWGGLYRDAASAQPELELFQKAGCSDARLVTKAGSGVRVLADAFPTQKAADALADRLRQRALLVTVESHNRPQ